MFNSLWSHGLQHTRPPCHSSSPGICPSSWPLHGWYHPAISSSDALFSFCPQSFPASGTFPMSWLFKSGGQNTEASASASALPTSVRGWFPLRFTGLIFLQSKGLSRVFSSTTIWKNHSSAFSLPYGAVLTSIHDYWKNHNFDYMDLCWQSGEGL